ncbi:hypothetical protein Cob_v008608 [Colletotrichum orbiculare MAFF 240422]|uniref:Uncharacterized protein n=1 Tax=Colletotrichum orbiculare (strain 104-T / ATCC 96160 / CBS 514.97 / LARS 414 / MAFF 240422) TaxID=1213857 RepID=A0A484FL89_COLOR|nr:hypothetical protein Cob_v008608 [Colletotrichum orbiculare MAFF 240422]
MEMKTYAYNHVDGADPIEADVYFEPGDSSGPPKPVGLHAEPSSKSSCRTATRTASTRPRCSRRPSRRPSLGTEGRLQSRQEARAHNCRRFVPDKGPESSHSENERREATHDLDSEDCFAISGTPSETEPWAYMLFGHYLCLHAFVLLQQMVIGPVFLGAEPSVWCILSGFDALYDGDLSYLDEPSRSDSTAGPPSRAQMSNWWYELSQIQNQYCAVTQALVSRLEGLSKPTRRLAALKDRLPSAHRPDGIILVSPENYSHVVLLHLEYFNFLRTVHLAATNMRQSQSGISDQTTSDLQAREVICVEAATLSIKILNNKAAQWETRLQERDTWLHSTNYMAAIAVLYRSIMRDPANISSRADLEYLRAGKLQLEHDAPAKISLPTVMNVFKDMLATAEDAVRKNECHFR